MNATHLHLILNHVPLFGTLFAWGLLAWGLAKRSTDLKKAALGLLVVTALAAVPVYVTGEPAEEVVKGSPGVSQSVIERHEKAAQVAFIAILALGAVALGALLLSARNRPMPPWVSPVMLCTLVVLSGLMAWTANLGGQVRHSEVRPGATPAPESALQPSGQAEDRD